MMTRFRIAIALIILLAIVYRSFFLSIERTALNSDEAVVGLMARHIVTAVAQEDRVLWITQNFPDLDSLIESRLRQTGVRYQVQDFGRLRAYYDFSERVDPASFNLNSTQPLNLGHEG